MEILIVDNNSTDNTLNLLRKIDDPRIKIYKNSKNIGAEANFNRCIQLAKGKYVGIFHADDVYAYNIVERQIQTFQQNPNIGAVFTTAFLINDSGKIIGERNLPKELRGKKVYYFTEIFISILRNGNFLMSPSAMVKSTVYKEIGLFNGERYGTAADLDMWLRILEKYPIAILDEKLVYHRVPTKLDKKKKIIEGYYGSGPKYLSGYFCTKQRPFFSVMDYYLSLKSCFLNIPCDAIYRYNFRKCIDNISRAVNYLIRGELQKAKELLKKSFSADVFRGMMENIKQPKFLAYWIFGMMLLFSVHLGLGRFLQKTLFWYQWNIGGYKDLCV